MALNMRGGPNIHPISRLRHAAREQQRQHYCFLHSPASLAAVSRLRTVLMMRRAV